MSWRKLKVIKCLSGKSLHDLKSDFSSTKLNTKQIYDNYSIYKVPTGKDCIQDGKAMSFVRPIQSVNLSNVYHTLNHPEKVVQSNAPAEQDTNRRIRKTHG